jgi:hypothetical protein
LGSSSVVATVEELIAIVVIAIAEVLLIVASMDIKDRRME